MPDPYGHLWRTLFRPATIALAGGRCEWCGVYETPRPRRKGERSNLTVAHLDGDAFNNAEENLACLCWLCHNAHDYPVRAKAHRRWRRERAVVLTSIMEVCRPRLPGMEVVCAA